MLCVWVRQHHDLDSLDTVFSLTNKEVINGKANVLQIFETTADEIL